MDNETWSEPRYFEVEGQGTKDFLCVEGWTTKQGTNGIVRDHLTEYYWFEDLPVYLVYLAKIATMDLLGENPDRLYRWIHYRNGRTTG